MGRERDRPAAAWQLARSQHGVITRQQLLSLGFSAEAIKHRVRRGRLHPIERGIYAVGRRELSQDGRWMAAVLICGSGALLSHRSAAELWRIVPRGSGPIDVAVPANARRSRPGIRLHRKRDLGGDGDSLRAGDRGRGDAVRARARRLRVRNIPLTDPVTTLIDFASSEPLSTVEAAVNEANHLDLVDPERLRAELGPRAGRRGVGVLATLLDRDTFTLTDTELERLFLPLAREAGLPLPGGQVCISRTRVDFYWSELGLVVECDSLRYHRTAAKQAEDVRRDQEHVRAGRRTVRITHFQVRYEPDYVRALLRDVFERLAPRS